MVEVVRTIDRYRGEFLGLIRSGSVQIVFANERELHSLYQTADFDTATAQLRTENILGVVTRSEHGSIIVAGDQTQEVAAARVGDVVDTTGAGDLYAAGFLFGLTHRESVARCGQLGSLCAAEVISHVGARPQRRLAELVQSS